jgi:tetratricopeptide (TPR) repeat protein
MTGRNVNRTNRFGIRYEVLVCLLLVFATLAVYSQVGQHEYINFDDNFYVTGNPYVRSGLNWESLVWAFSFENKERTYWHPLSWLSHMLDVQLYGMNSGQHHLTNVLFHVANTLLLFLLLNRMTGSVWRCGFVAMLFAVHPINVESVAWIAERKNVLSTFFFMLALFGYTYYAERPSIFRYFIILVAFSMGLLAKPMVVTLPFVLVLLDYWPLRRLFNKRSEEDIEQGIKQHQGFLRHGTLCRLAIVEKIPLLALSVISIYVSSSSLKGAGNVISVASVPIKSRIACAIVSYIQYVVKMIWPRHLTIYYPYPEMVPVSESIVALLLLIAVSAAAIITLKKHPYLAVGWFWFLGTLVPVSGLHQAGLWPEMADRWAYIPLIGLFVVVAWGLGHLLDGWRRSKLWIALGAGAVCVCLITAARVQVDYWKNSITLFEHALEVNPRFWVAHNILGAALAEQHRTVESNYHFRQALKIFPNYAQAHVNFGNSLLAQGKIDEAIYHLSEAMRIDSSITRSNNTLGLAFLRKGKIEKAIRHFRLALQQNPDFESAGQNLNLALSIDAQFRADASNLRSALDFAPEDPALDVKIKLLLKRKRELDQTIIWFQKFLSAYTDLSRLDIDDLDHISDARRQCYQKLPMLKRIIKVRPNSPEIYYFIACIYSQKGQKAESIAWLNRAVQHGFNDWTLIRTDLDLENIRDSAEFRTLIEQTAM